MTTPLFTALARNATVRAQAIASALELAGPGARVLRVWREGDW
jgi:hypothetical protein